MKFGTGQPLTRVEDSRLLTGNGYIMMIYLLKIKLICMF